MKHFHPLIWAKEVTTVEAAPLVTPADNVNNKPIILDHRIFDSQNGWEETESMQHPTLRLRLTAEKTDYDHIGAKFSRIAASYVTVVTDTGAQSCLWGLKDFYRYGFIKSDLLPVKHSMVAVNSERINIVGAILVRLSGLDDHGRNHTAPIMVYISSSTKRC